MNTYSTTFRSIGSCVLIGLGACTNQDATEAGPDLIRYDSAEVEVVVNRGLGVWGDSLSELEEVMRIGVTQGDEPYQFSNVNDLLVDTDGTLFVGNSQTATVRVFSAGGVFSHEFGGRGEGPSEIPYAVNDLFFADGRVTVIDWQAGGKVLVYEKDGTFVDSWVSRMESDERITPMGWSDGRWIVSRYVSPGPDPVAPGGRIERSNDPYLYDDRERTLSEPIRDIFLPTVLFTARGAGEGGRDWPLFRPLSGVGQDGNGRFYASPGDAYRIRVFDPIGTPVRSIRRDIAPTPITPDDVDEFIEISLAPYDTMTIPASWGTTREAQKESYRRRIEVQRTFPIPEFMPPTGRMVVGHEGTIWIQSFARLSPAQFEFDRMRGGSRIGSDRPAIWDVFDAEGTFLGSVSVPSRFHILSVTEETATGVELDELDVERIVTYRVVRGS